MRFALGSAVVNELKMLTLQSRTVSISDGIEHAVVTLKDGSTWIVSGGEKGINFSGFDVDQLIVHSHGWTTGPSTSDFNYLNNNGLLFNNIVEIGNPNMIQYNLNRTFSEIPIEK